MLLSHVLSFSHEEGCLMPNTSTIPAWNFWMQLHNKQKLLIIKWKQLIWVKGKFYYLFPCYFFFSIQCYLDSLH